MSQFHIYTDGACSGNPGPGGWGVVILDHQKQFLQEFSGWAESTTNNRMEVQAAIAGIRKALDLDPCPEIILYSDSNYLIQAYTKGWMDSWLRTNWKKGTVKNQDLWLELNKLLNLVKIRWIKVKGHADNTYNNRCDQLAVGAIKTKFPNQPIFEEDPAFATNNQGQAQPCNEISASQVKLLPFDPIVLNNPLSDKPSENRCLVSQQQLAENVAKISRVCAKYSYEETKELLESSTLKSIDSWVGIATINHPTIKIHPLFLQVGDMADFWLRSNSSKYLAPSRVDLVKFICTYIVNDAIPKARELGLENPRVD